MDENLELWASGQETAAKAYDCGCLAIDPIECYELRVYGYFPATLEDGDGRTEGCGCPCHDEALEGEDDMEGYADDENW